MIDETTIGPCLWQAALYVLMVAFPVLAAAMLLGALGYVLQTGGIQTAPKKERFDLKRIDPIAGFKRMVSLSHWVEGLKSVLKFGIFGGICYLTIRREMDNILMLGAMPPAMALETSVKIAMKIVFNAGLLMILLALADYGYQFWQYRQKLRMSTQEVKEERKNLEGDPTSKRRQRTKQMELSRSRMMSNVAKSDVVVTNPTHFAVALRYRPGEDGAPRVVAKGADYIAKRIRMEARKHGVPIYEDPFVARSLYANCKLEQEIPYTLFRAVAEILAYVYKISGKLRSQPRLSGRRPAAAAKRSSRGASWAGGGSGAGPVPAI